jgi:hypothetical protein
MRNAWRHHASPVRFLSAPYHYRASRPNGGAQLHIFAAIASHRPRGSAIQCHRAQRRPRRRCHRQNRQRRHREFRKIRISVIGRPDLKVQTRDGYYAMQDNQALDPKREFQELTGSLLTPIPFNGIPIPTSYTELVTSPAPHLTVRFIVSSTSLSWTSDAKGSVPRSPSPQRTRANMASAARGNPACFTSTPSHCQMASLHRQQLRPASISRCRIATPIVCASLCATMPADVSARRRSRSAPRRQADRYFPAISISPSGTTRHSTPGRACHVDPSA